MKRKFRIIAVISAIFFLAGCGFLQVKTPIEAYSTALGYYTKAGTKILFYYDRGDAELKATMAAEDGILSTLDKAKKVLNAWGKIMDTSGDDAAQQAQWEELEDELIFYITNQMK